MRSIKAVLIFALGALAPFAPLSVLAQNPQVEVKTSMGSFTLELYQDKAPKSVANFMQYTKEGFFKDTIFHRVIDGFMIQGGGFDRNMQQKPTRGTIDNEANNGLKNDTGTIAMARTSAPHSATAQFYINVADNAALNHREPTTQGWGYAVFGRVTRGMDVVMRIAKASTGNAGPHQNVPLKPITIEAVTPVRRRQRPKNKGQPEMIRLHTNHGIITLDLDADKAPETVKNFLAYVESGHYSNTVFHRVIDNFMVQGGGFEPGMKQKPTNDPVKNEADNGLKNERYTVAMARTSDPHSASAQFFINVGDNDFLNHSAPTSQGWGYCVFGRVVEGQDVVDKIKDVKTGNRGGHGDVPVEDVLIERAEVV